MPSPRLAVLCFVAACGPSPSRPPAVQADAPNTATAESAAPSPAPSAIQTEPSPRADAVDLLHAVPATVVVSSSAGGEADRPQHLVDGRSDTAWRSRPGDRLGAWLSLRVPRDAHLEALELTLRPLPQATTAQGAGGTPHTLRVRVFDADRIELGLWTLDASSSAPQRLPLGTPGGHLNLYVEASEPEGDRLRDPLALSALRLLGTPGTTRLAEPAPPRVEIGEAPRARSVGFFLAEGEDPHDLFGRFRSESETCGAYATALRAAVQALRDTPPSQPWCTPLPLRARRAATSQVSQVELELPGHSSARMLQLHTKRGVVIPKGAALCTQIHEGGCDDDLVTTESTLRSARFEPERAHIEVENTVLWRESQPPSRRRERLIFDCQLAPEPAICSVTRR